MGKQQTELEGYDYFGNIKSVNVPDDIKRVMSQRGIDPGQWQDELNERISLGGDTKADAIQRAFKMFDQVGGTTKYTSILEDVTRAREARKVEVSDRREARAERLGKPEAAAPVEKQTKSPQPANGQRVGASTAFFGSLWNSLTQLAEGPVDALNDFGRAVTQWESEQSWATDQMRGNAKNSEAVYTKNKEGIDSFFESLRVQIDSESQKNPFNISRNDNGNIEVDFSAASDPKKWLAGVGSGVGSLVSILAPNKKASMLMSFAQMYSSNQDDAVEAGLTGIDATLYTTGTTLVTSALEMLGDVGILKALKGDAGKEVIKRIVKEKSFDAIEEISRKGITSEIFDDVVSRTFKETIKELGDKSKVSAYKVVAKNLAKKVAKGAVPEAGTEFTQEFAVLGGKELFNATAAEDGAVEGKGRFATDILKTTADATFGALLGGFLGGTIGSFAPNSRELTETLGAFINADIKEQMAANPAITLDELKSNSRMTKLLDVATKNGQFNDANGQLDQAKYDGVANKASQIYDTYYDFKELPGFSADDRMSMFHITNTRNQNSEKLGAINQAISGIQEIQGQIDDLVNNGGSPLSITKLEATKSQMEDGLGDINSTTGKYATQEVIEAETARIESVIKQAIPEISSNDDSRKVLGRAFLRSNVYPIEDFEPTSETTLADGTVIFMDDDTTAVRRLEITPNQNQVSIAQQLINGKGYEPVERQTYSIRPVDNLQAFKETGENFQSATAVAKARDISKPYSLSQDASELMEQTKEFVSLASANPAAVPTLAADVEIQLAKNYDFYNQIHKQRGADKEGVLAMTRQEFDNSVGFDPAVFGSTPKPIANNTSTSITPGTATTTATGKNVRTTNPAPVSKNTAIARQEPKSISSVIGSPITYNGRPATIEKKGDRFVVETDREVLELPETATDESNIYDYGITTAKTKKGSKSKNYDVAFNSENEVTVNGVGYLVNNDESGSVGSLSPKNNPDQKITNEAMLVAVEMARSKEAFNTLSQPNSLVDDAYDAAMNALDVDSLIVDRIFEKNFNETTEKALTRMENGQPLSNAQRLALDLWVTDAIIEVNNQRVANPNSKALADISDYFELVNETLYSDEQQIGPDEETEPEPGVQSSSPDGINTEEGVAGPGGQNKTAISNENINGQGTSDTSEEPYRVELEYAEERQLGEVIANIESEESQIQQRSGLPDSQQGEAPESGEGGEDVAGDLDGLRERDRAVRQNYGQREGSIGQIYPEASVQPNDSSDSQERTEENAGTVTSNKKSIPNASRKIANKKYLDQLKRDPSNINEEVLQFFIGGGRLTSDFLADVVASTQLKGADQQQYFSLTAREIKGGLTIKRLAHKLWEESIFGTEANSDQDFRNAIIEVLKKHNTTKSMVEEMIENDPELIQESVPDDYDPGYDINDSSPKLPAKLDNVNPTLLRGSTEFTIKFPTDVSKALYMSTMPGAQGKPYFDFLEKVFPEKTKLQLSILASDQKKSISDQLRSATGTEIIAEDVTIESDVDDDYVPFSKTVAGNIDPETTRRVLAQIAKAFPKIKVNIAQTLQEYLDNLNSIPTAKQVFTKDSVPYGFINPVDGSINLNPESLNTNTAIHEFGHVWNMWAKVNNPELYAKGMALVQGTSYFKRVQADPSYKALTQEQMLDEALATAIGDKGESFVSSSRKKSFSDWMNELFGKVKEYLGIRKLSPQRIADLSFEEFTSGVVADLLSGEPISQMTSQQVADILRGNGVQPEVKSSNIVSNEDIQNYAKRIEEGEYSLKRLPRELEQSRAKVGRRLIEATIVSGRGEASSTEFSEGRRERQEQRLEEYAKREGIWIEDYESRFGEFIANGEEQKVYYDGSGYVHKANNLYFHDEDITTFFDRLAAHKYLFPDTSYELIGFARDNNGKFQVITKQPFIITSNRKLSKTEILDFYKKLGFESIGGYDVLNDYLLIIDTHPGNIAYDQNGIVRIFDPVIYLNTAMEGYGGTQEYGDIDDSDIINNSVPEENANQLGDILFHHTPTVFAAAGSGETIGTNTELKDAAREELTDAGIYGILEKNKTKKSVSGSATTTTVVEKGLTDADRKVINAVAKKYGWHYSGAKYETIVDPVTGTKSTVRNDDVWTRDISKETNSFFTPDGKMVFMPLKGKSGKMGRIAQTISQTESWLEDLRSTGNYAYKTAQWLIDSGFDRLNNIETFIKAIDGKDGLLKTLIHDIKRTSAENRNHALNIMGRAYEDFRRDMGKYSIHKGSRTLDTVEKLPVSIIQWDRSRGGSVTRKVSLPISVIMDIVANHQSQLSMGDDYNKKKVKDASGTEREENHTSAVIDAHYDIDPSDPTLFWKKDDKVDDIHKGVHFKKDVMMEANSRGELELVKDGRQYGLFHQSEMDRMENYLMSSGPDEVRAAFQKVRAAFNDKAVRDMIQRENDESINPDSPFVVIKDYSPIQSVSNVSAQDRVNAFSPNLEDAKLLNTRTSRPDAIYTGDVLDTFDYYKESVSHILGSTKLVHNLKNLQQAITTDYDGLMKKRIDSILTGTIENLQNYRQSQFDISSKEDNLRPLLFLMHKYTGNIFRSNLGISTKQIGTWFSAMGLGYIGDKYLFANRGIWSTMSNLSFRGSTVDRAAGGTIVEATGQGLKIPGGFDTAEAPYLRDLMGEGLEGNELDKHRKRWATVIHRVIYGQSQYTEAGNLGSLRFSSAGRKKMKQLWNATDAMFEEYGMANIRRLDRAVILGYKVAAEAQAQDELKPGESITDEHIQDKIAKAVTETLYLTNQMSDPADLTMMQRNPSFGNKVLAMYSGQTQKLWNQLSGATIEYFKYKDTVSAADRTLLRNRMRGALVSNLLVNTMWMATANMGASILRGWLRGDDDKEKGYYQEKFAWDVARYMTGLAPGLFSQVAQFVISDIDNEQWTDEIFDIPGSDTIKQGWSAMTSLHGLISNIWDDKTEKENDKLLSDFTYNFAKIFGVVTGLPKTWSDPLVKQIQKGLKPPKGLKESDIQLDEDVSFEGAEEFEDDFDDFDDEDIDFD